MIITIKYLINETYTIYIEYYLIVLKLTKFCVFQISYLILMRNILWADTYYTQVQLKI